MAPWWHNYLTRDHVYCSLCYRESQLAWKAGDRTRQAWVKIANPRQERNPINPRLKAAYILETRAAFRRHVIQCHPNMLDKIAWRRP